MAPPADQIAVQVVREGDDFERILEVKKQPVVEPTEGEVLVRVLLRPINPADLWRILGKLPGTTPPFNPGNEGVGVVEQNGPGCSKFKAGQRVCAASWPGHAGPPPNGRPFGTFQQYLAVPEKDLVAVPDEITDEQAAQFLINPTTAFGMVETLDVPEGQWLLQTAAGSVVGRIAIAIAKSKGIRTINVVRRAAQKQELLDAGADEVIVSSEENIAERVAEITGGQGAYGAIEAVGGDVLEQVIGAVRKGGTVLVYGNMSGGKGQFEIRDVLYGGKTITGFAILRWLPQQKAAGTADDKLQQVWQLFKDGVIKTPVGGTFPLEEAVKGIKESQRPGKAGKVLLSG